MHKKLRAGKIIMKYSKLISILKEELGEAPKQIDLCTILSLKPTTISARAQRDSFFSQDELEKIAKHYSIKINFCEYIDLDYYPDEFLLLDKGKFNYSQNCVKYKVPREFFKNINLNTNYLMFHTKENSMSPLIDFGDFIILENDDSKKIDNGKLYVFLYKDRLYLKRLSVNINQIVVQSQNKDFLTQYIEYSENAIKLIGEVICHGKMYGDYLIKKA